MIPVIVVSGRDLHRNKERALNAGAVEYLQKPWNDDELLEMIARYSADPSPSEMPPTAGAMEIALPTAA
jgi:CheY-like chemotaxis protein